MRNCWWKGFMPAGGGATSLGARGTMDAPGSVVSLRSSLVVKAAWSGTRSPMTNSSRTAVRCRTSSTEAGTSYLSIMFSGKHHVTCSLWAHWVLGVPADEGERGDDAFGWVQGRVQSGDGAAGGEEKVCVVELQGGEGCGMGM